MELYLSNGQKMFINDEIAYKEYLKRKIEQYAEISKTRGLTIDEEKELSENMNLYNQIIDYENIACEDSFNQNKKL